MTHLDISEMVSQIHFDHEKDSLGESMGLSQEQLDALGEKLKEIVEKNEIKCLSMAFEAILNDGSLCPAEIIYALYNVGAAKQRERLAHLEQGMMLLHLGKSMHQDTHDLEEILNGMKKELNLERWEFSPIKIDPSSFE